MMVFHFVAFDLASIMLECNLCGASVVLLRFITVARPSLLLVPRMADMPESAIK